jgi:hypothetical protein
MMPKELDRPVTQGGSRLLFSREPTITEEVDNERRHMYSRHCCRCELASGFVFVMI